MATRPTHSLLDPALLERVKGLTLVARRVVEGVLHGLHHSPLHGLSIEFVQHRAYTPGDELKRLDWRVLGRSDRYVIKQYQQETNLRAVVLLDCSRSMAYGGPIRARSASEGQPRVADAAHSTPGGRADQQADTDADLAAPSDDARSKFHYASRLAAALAYLMLHQGDSVGLVLTNYRIVEQLAPRATPGQLRSLCHILEGATPAGITDVSGVVGQLAARLKRRSLVVLISDLLDDPESVLAALGQLHHRGHEVVVFQVLDPHELDFDLGLAGSGVTIIRDMETGTEFAAEPALVRDLVRQEVRKFCEQLDAGARRHAIDLVRCRTSDPLERVLTSYLHARMTGKGKQVAFRKSPT